MMWIPIILVCALYVPCDAQHAISQERLPPAPTEALCMLGAQTFIGRAELRPGQIMAVFCDIATV